MHHTLHQGIAISAHKFATDLRLLANRREMEEPFEEDPDRQFAFRCLLEGCAMHIQHAYEHAHLHVARAGH